MNNTKGRLKKISILEYRGWLIVFEPSFPSNNYILTRKDASHGFQPAYCSSLDSALCMLFDQLLIANIDETEGYGKDLVDLSKVILQTKDEFRILLSKGIKTMICEVGGDV